MPSISIDYGALLYRYKKNWYWFVLAMLLFGAAAYLRIKYSTPQYATSASFILEDPSSSEGVTAREFTRQFGYAETQSIENELNVLKSRSLLTDVVRELNLGLRITYVGDIRNSDLYEQDGFELMRMDTAELDESEVEYGSVELITTSSNKNFLIKGKDTTTYFPGSPIEIGNQHFTFYSKHSAEDQKDRKLIIANVDPGLVAEEMGRRLSVRQLGNSNTVMVRYEDSNPYRAADVVNQLLNIYSIKIIEERSQTGKQTIAFISERLNNVTRDLFNVEANLSNLRQEEGLIVDNSTRGSDYLSQLNVADAQLSELQVRKSLIEQIRNQVATEEYRSVSIASEIIDGTLAQLVTRYNELVIQREQQLASSTLVHPLVIALSAQLDELKGTLITSINTIYRETNARIERVEQRIQPIENNMQSIPEDERRLLKVQRQQQIKQNLFIYLQQKLEEAAISVAAQVPNTRILDAARPNLTSIYPKPAQNYIAAIGLALLLPGLFFFLREVLNTKVQLEEDVERRTSQPIIGRIAASKKGQNIVISPGNRSGVAEMFRLLRTNLTFLLPQDKTPVILMTSSVSGEGKSFVASNLAYTMALGNRRVVIVGADMRKPRLSAAIFAAPSKEKPVINAGLSDYLTETADYGEVVRPTINENLFIIESGPIPPDPSELLLQPRMAQLFEKLREDFDVIILDAPPVGLVTDALQLKNFIDISLYVVRLGHTPKTSLEVLNDVADNEKLPNVGIVLNGLQPKRDYGHGYAQGYYK